MSTSPSSVNASSTSIPRTTGTSLSTYSTASENFASTSRTAFRSADVLSMPSPSDYSAQSASSSSSGFSTITNCPYPTAVVIENHGATTDATTTHNGGPITCTWGCPGRPCTDYNDCIDPYPCMAMPNGTICWWVLYIH